jgi:hypothetical protein
MKILQLYYPEERVKLPKEDAWAFDKNDFAFAVADGVHLLPGIEYRRGSNYPAPSPAGKLAQEFCANFIKFQKGSSLEAAFTKANRAVFHLNKGRRNDMTFLRSEAYYAATAATGRIKGRIFEWRGICDSSITIVNAKAKILFTHTDHWHHNDFGPILANYFHLDRSYVFRTFFRNALSKTGKKLGYGVITGQKAAEAYTWFGKRKLQKGDVAILATDGFEAYLKDASFRRAVISMNRSRVERVMEQLKKSHPNNHEFLSERTLVAVGIDLK